MKLKFLYIGFYLLLFSPLAFAQTGELTSLLEKLKLSKPDTNQVKLLNKIGDEYAYNDIKTARKYYHDAFELSKKLDFLRGIVRYYSSEGELLNIEGKYAETMQLLREGVKVSIARKDKMREGIMYENMGNTFGLMQKLDSATNYYFKSLKIFEAANDSVKIANVYNDLSSIFTQTDKQETALKYINQAITISQNFQDGFYLSHLINKENILWKLKRRSEANAVNNQIIALAKKLNDAVAMADALQNFCNHDAEMSQYESLTNHAIALEKLNPILQTAERALLANYWLSVAYYFKKDFTKSKFFIEKTLKNGTNQINSQHLQQIYYQYAKIILAQNQDPILAEKYNMMADSLKEMSLNNTILKTTKELETKYETDKKEVQLKQLETENQSKRRLVSLLVFSVIILVGALILFALWMRNRSRIRSQEQILNEQKLKQLENEKQLLASRAVLQGQDEERSRLAKDLHDGLGGILSSVKYSFLNMKTSFILQEEHALAFEKSMNLLDTSLAELRRVSHNMMPESLAKLGLEAALKDYIQTISENSGVKFTYQSFGLDEIILENIYKTTIFRVIQELTTNIIRHANASEALVQVIVKNNQISITIEDNGVGFDEKQVNSSKSMGIQNLYNRIQYLKGTIDLQTKPNDGCSYYIEIPLNHD